ncbi:hypothetical protein B0H15DRAFT_178631 [Mycena belliarum]|uniref:Secreted protein n=1 Tax=Mycena belliarum TaxID=1033014 RepID=A0AAD6XSA5_9AGAR|nr:hypothetical protein B0H15DRAFT_178631 [Mycena belliae]
MFAALGLIFVVVATLASRRVNRLRDGAVARNAVVGGEGRTYSAKMLPRSDMGDRAPDFRCTLRLLLSVASSGSVGNFYV